MSQENVEIVRHCYDLFSEGDPDGMLAYLDDGIEIEEAPQMPGAESFRGHSGFARAIEHWAGEFDDFGVEIERLVEAQDRVIALVNQRGRGRQSGVAVEIQVANLFRLKDGKIVKWQMHVTLEDALEAAGLSE